MLVETAEDGSPRQMLKATRLGRIAVRQMLAPSTVITLARELQAPDAERLKLLDLLLLCVVTDDCDTRVPVDFEELEELGALLAEEPSTLLGGGAHEAQHRLGIGGRKLLTVIKTALVLRAWTRVGEPEEVAESFGCYAFEIRRLKESLERILTAAVAVLTPPKEADTDEGETRPTVMMAEEAPLKERIRALAAMVAHGVDEQTVTLTYIDGIGGTLARRLHDAGITDIEELATAEPADLGQLRGVSVKRAERWIEEATEMIRRRSAFSFRETGSKAEALSGRWDSSVDPYRLRRALDLTVQSQGDGFTVSGGLEPHRIRRTGEALSCDCADFDKGHVCKHVLAARLHRKEPGLVSLVERLSAEGESCGLDLFQLWFDGGKR
jgi:helicase